MSLCGNVCSFSAALHYLYTSFANNNRLMGVYTCILLNLSVSDMKAPVLTVLSPHFQALIRICCIYYLRPLADCELRSPATRNTHSTHSSSRWQVPTKPLSCLPSQHNHNKLLKPYSQKSDGEKVNEDEWRSDDGRTKMKMMKEWPGFYVSSEAYVYGEENEEKVEKH